MQPEVERARETLFVSTDISLQGHRGRWRRVWRGGSGLFSDLFKTQWDQIPVAPYFLAI